MMKYGFIHCSVHTVITDYCVVHLCIASIALVAVHDRYFEENLGPIETRDTIILVYTDSD